jgi:biopolymer transport protein ExbD
VNLRSGRREAQPDITLNVTPLIDVILVVLIFFVATTTFRHEGELRIDLPGASFEPGADPQTPVLEVGIDAGGRYFVNGQGVSAAGPVALGAALTAAAGDRRDQTLIIRADGRTPYQAVITALDVAGRLGFQHLAMPTAPVEALPDRRDPEP